MRFDGKRMDVNEKAIVENLQKHIADGKKRLDQLHEQLPNKLAFVKYIIDYDDQSAKNITLKPNDVFGSDGSRPVESNLTVDSSEYAILYAIYNSQFQLQTFVEDLVNILKAGADIQESKPSEFQSDQEFVSAVCAQQEIFKQYETLMLYYCSFKSH
jgi:hypothetical protein